MNKLKRISLRLFLLLGIERYASNTSHGGCIGINPVGGRIRDSPFDMARMVV